MRDYELIYIVQPEVEEEERTVLLERIHEWVDGVGGQVIKVDQWGQRRLGYPIEKFERGFYVLLDLQLPPEGVRELERRLQITEPVLRYLTVRKEQ